MSSSLQQFGELSCRLVTELASETKPRLVVLLCHGFGAPGDDLVPLGIEILRARPNLRDRVAFVFPAAPIAMEEMMGFDSRAWWPIDMERMMIAGDEERSTHLRSNMPPQLPDALRKLEATRTEVQQHFDVEPVQMIVGGFSQGAMLVTELALTCGDTLAGLAVFSGTLLDAERWTRLAGETPPLRVIQSHGQEDPILPFSNAEALYEMLTQQNHDVQFIPFHGVHTIPPQSLQALLALIESRLND